MSLACVTSACLEELIRKRSSLFNEPFHGALLGEKKNTHTPPSETDFPIKFIEHEKGFWRWGSEVAGPVHVEAPPSPSSLEDENKTNKQKSPGSR